MLDLCLRAGVALILAIAVAGPAAADVAPDPMDPTSPYAIVGVVIAVAAAMFFFWRRRK